MVNAVTDNLQQERDREHTYWKGGIFLRLLSLLGYLLRLVGALYELSVLLNRGKYDGQTSDSLASLFAIDLSSSSECKRNSVNSAVIHAKILTGVIGLMAVFFTLLVPIPLVNL